ncbi:MAG: hypothetical protein IKN91_07540 [Paludibacteraceae bacterium]|nr:hypothetical protein [Paludibacteraceae bacterium]
MKKFLLPLILVLFFALGFSGCKDKDEVSSKGYPDIETIQRYIDGDWEVTTWIESDGSSHGYNGYVFMIDRTSYSEFGGGYLTINEDGHLSSPLQYYLEPVFNDESVLEKTHGIFIYIFGGGDYFSGEYLITDISSSSMTWREFSVSDGKIVLEEGMIFTKITE